MRGVARWMAFQEQTAPRPGGDTEQKGAAGKNMEVDGEQAASGGGGEQTEGQEETTSSAPAAKKSCVPPKESEQH